MKTCLHWVVVVLIIIALTAPSKGKAETTGFTTGSEIGSTQRCLFGRSEWATSLASATSSSQSSK